MAAGALMERTEAMSDVIRFTCSKCGQKYRAPSRLTGRARVCVKCGNNFHIAADGTSTSTGMTHLESGAPIAAKAAAVETPPITSAAPPAPVATTIQEAPAPVMPEPLAAPIQPAPVIPEPVAAPIQPAPVQVAAAASAPIAPVSVAPIIAAVTETPKPIVEVAPAKPIEEVPPARQTVVEQAPVRQPLVEVQLVQQFVEMAPMMRQAAPAQVPPEPVHLPELPAPEKKQCPFCGEDILKMAVKCKHCGEFLDGSGAKAAEPQIDTVVKNAAILSDAWSKAELAAADTRVRADRAGADARAKAEEVAAVARRNEERRAAIHRQIEMQAESDYRQVLLRAADSLAAAEKAAVSMCRFYSDVYHTVERMGLDAAQAIQQAERLGDREEPGKNTLSVVSQVMDLVENPPIRFYRAHEKIVDAFKAYSDMEGIWRNPSGTVAGREALLADLHNRFTASMGDMRALIRTSEFPGA
jgi:ribosomal protein L37AE/L43A